jgi:D-glycero-D-manno-heptose 1,7-bisphosphate phosphatase
LVTKAVFLDRDGVITQEPPHYAHRPDQMTLIPGAGDAIRRLNDSGFMVIIVTNQAGIAYGYYQEKDMLSFNRTMSEALSQSRARIDSVYFCPHHAEAKIEKYRLDCDCRKPKPGMLLKAVKEYGITLKNSFMIGDKLTDIEAGNNAGCKSILVKTGYGIETAQNIQTPYEYLANDLYDAVRFILK